jgi:methyltransferase (TIGR00027 family)
LRSTSRKLSSSRELRLAALGAEPIADLRAVPIDLRRDWPAALRQAGFDADRPTAWIVEGLLAYLPPDAQDRLLDDITELSADSSRVAIETFANSTDADAAQAREIMQNVIQRWRDHGFDVELGDLGYEGERRDVATYLDSRGWHSVRRPLRQLLAANGLTAIPQTGDQASFADSYYCTSILHK